MKKLVLVSILSLSSMSLAHADTWAFDNKDAIQKEASQVFMIDVKEAQPSWSFSEADSYVKRVCYESYAFD